jgi:hypothetical protein
MVPLSEATNVATFSLAPGYSHFNAFCAESNIYGYDENDHIIIDNANIISDDEDESNTSAVPSKDNNTDEWKPTDQPCNCQFRLDGPAKIKQEHSSTQGRGNIPQDDNEYPRQLLRYHQ